jgi:hypothetical protein
MCRAQHLVQLHVLHGRHCPGAWGAPGSRVEHTTALDNGGIPVDEIDAVPLLAQAGWNVVQPDSALVPPEPGQGAEEMVRPATRRAGVPLPGTPRVPSGASPASAGLRCPRCGFDNPAGTLFCGACTSLLHVDCPQCGWVNPPAFAFCGQCATPLNHLAVPVAPRPTPLLTPH